ncbi:conserved hypothetical protein [Histoplasma capsulatum H143]|uniref:Uncharacterized protein n=1 Tax=Ajellomyces capsulatus (strain H143) TaxID=544712 RepID=C6H8X6_AJECH|nr:conserved hypothetical protein [Histoplasma capsulatum H143]
MPPTVNHAHHHDRKGDSMDMDDDDNDGYESDSIASKSSKKTNLTDSADYGEDSEKDTSNLAGLLTDDEHPLEYYMEMMADTNESLLQYNEYAANSLKLLNCIEQEWFNTDPQPTCIPDDSKTDKAVSSQEGSLEEVLLNLCYRHIKITLLKNPTSGPNNILIEFTVEFIKTFLGKKEDSYVVLLSLLFADQAFTPLDDERVLTSAQQLIDLKIPDNIYQIELHLDPALNEVLMFQRLKWMMEQIKISATEALMYSTIRLWIRCVGELSTFCDIVQLACQQSSSQSDLSALESLYISQILPPQKDEQGCSHHHPGSESTETYHVHHMLNAPLHQSTLAAGTDHGAVKISQPAAPHSEAHSET